MKRRVFFVIVLFLFLESHQMALSLNVIKNDTYVKYALLVPTDQEKNDVNIFEVYTPWLPTDTRKVINEHLKGEGKEKLVSLFVRGDVFITFKISGVRNNIALVNVTLQLNNVWINNRYHIPQLNISRTLILDTMTMEYRTENNITLGRPIFLIDPMHPPKKGSLMVNMKLVKELGAITKNLVVENISYRWGENSRLHTYYRIFQPPYIYVSSSVVPFNWEIDGGYYSATIGTYYVYDFDTGVLITAYSDVSPELLALGVINGDSYDYMASEKMEKLERKGTKYELWNPGFNLYDTNIKFPGTSSSKAPITGMRYFFVASLTLLVIVAVFNWRWRRE